MTKETGQPWAHFIVSDSIPQGAALAYEGRWPKREPGRANVNVFDPGYRKGNMGESSAGHGVEVFVTRLGDGE